MTKKKVNGVLPSREWLIRNGYRELVKCMDEHPDKFAHISQNIKPQKEESK